MVPWFLPVQNLMVVFFLMLTNKTLVLLGAATCPAKTNQYIFLLSLKVGMTMEMRRKWESLGERLPFWAGLSLLLFVRSPCLSSSLNCELYPGSLMPGTLAVILWLWGKGLKNCRNLGFDTLELMNQQLSTSRLLHKSEK